jgi:cytoskeletal protein RodZ
MDTVGTYLRAHRERAGLSIEQVSRTTRIRCGALTALETDQLSQLPGGVVCRGYVRAYASFVGADHVKAVRLLEVQTNPEPVMGRTLEPPSAASNRFLKPLPLLILFVALVALLGTVYALSVPGSAGSRMSSVEATDVDSGTTRSFSPLKQP